jgi:hypothetical protein
LRREAPHEVAALHSRAAHWYAENRFWVEAIRHALAGQETPLAAYLGVGNIVARNGIWAAAVLFPAGFFLSSAGRGVTRPNKLIVLLYLGIAALTAGVLALGIGLLTA